MVLCLTNIAYGVRRRFRSNSLESTAKKPRRLQEAEKRISQIGPDTVGLPQRLGEDGSGRSHTRRVFDALKQPTGS
jgi:hypothetical protein